MRMRFVLVVYCIMYMTLLSATLMLGMCGCYPAGRTLSEEQVRQKNNEIQLRSLARQTLADADWLTNICNISHDGNFRINTNQESVYISIHPCNKLSIDTIRTQHATPISSTFTNFESHIVAYEEFGLWSDGTVLVFFENLGVMRMRESDFKELLKGKGKKLKYLGKKRCWISQTEDRGEVSGHRDK